MKYINQEFIRFVLFGGVNTLLGYLIYVILLVFLNYKVSFTITYVSSIFISYYLNSKFVFYRKVSLKKGLVYPSVYLIQYLICMLLLHIFVEILNLSKFIAPILAVLLTVPVTFFLSRSIIKGQARES